MVSIIEVGHVFCGFLQCGLGFIHGFPHVGDEVRCSFDHSGADRLSAKVGVLPGVKSEWSLTGGRVDSVVVGKFCNGEPLHPVILVMVDEDAEVLLDLLVDLLCLSIHQRVECHGEVCLNPEEQIEFSHELGSEHGASVTNDGLW
jgi:hypothetical protein